MKYLLSNFKISINQNLFIKEPSSSELGKKILSNAIEMIEEIGFENFTFRKLGQQIDSPEASIYRYFESKNQLLVYITSWYWGWMEYRLVLETANIDSPETRFEKAIALITTVNNDKLTIEGIEINKLHKIVISESSKSYLTKDVDKVNKEGAFHLNYKQFVARLAEIIKEINPSYKFPHMLIIYNNRRGTFAGIFCRAFTTLN
jgi:AcrR family transcriptional regulator